MQIRRATSLDREEVRGVHLRAFPEGESEIVSTLAVSLLTEKTMPPTLSLVAETGGLVVGHVAFSPATSLDNKVFQGYILAPLGVWPDYQKRGIGSRLIKRGMQQLAAIDVDVLLVYGDPRYYSRFGFDPDVAERFTPPYRLQYPFGWQGIVLHKGRTGGSSIRIACVTSLCHPALW